MDTKTDTNPPILCVRCGGAGANVYGGGVWSHCSWSDCIEHLTARVEAAEALAYERLESALFAEQRATDAEIERDSANVEAALEQSNAREAWIRVAELETQLAEQQWRPGSETPPADWYQTAETDVFSYAYFTGATWHGHPDDLPPLWYRPIPPLPPAPDAQEPTP